MIIYYLIKLQLHLFLSLTPNSVALNCPSTGFTIDNVPPCNPLCTPEHSVHIKTPKVVEIHLGATI